MTGPGGDAIFRLRWEQENAQVPAQARAALLGLAQAQQGVTQTSRQAVLGWPSQSQILQAMQRDAARGGESLKKMGDNAKVGGEGLGHVQRAMSMVALSATGTTGPVGHLANSLVMFGAGSTLTLGVAAGLAVIALGYRQITKDAREAATAAKESVDKLNELAAKRVPAQDALQKARAAEAAARDFYKALRAKAATTPPGSIEAMQGPAVSEQALRDAKKALEAAHAYTAQMEGPAAQEHKKAGEQAADQWLEGFQERFAQATVPELAGLLADLQAKIAAGGAAAAAKFGPLLEQVSAQLIATTPHPDNVRGFRPPSFGAATGFPGFNAPIAGSFQAAAQTAQATAEQAAEQTRYNEALEHTRAILVRAQTPQQVFNQGMDALQLMLDRGAISADQFHDGVQRLNKDLELATKRSNVLAVTIVNAVSGAIMAIASGGGTGGFLSAIGGLVGFVNPLVGVGIAGIGGIISASQSRGVRIDSYGQQALDQLKAIPDGPQRLELTIVSPFTGEIIDRVLYELGQRQRTNPVRRMLPDSVRQG